MANVPKAITDLPVASAMGDDDLLVVSQNATTSSIKGELIKGYAQNAVASQVTAAQTAATQASQSATQAEAARQGAAAAQTAAENAQDAAETARDQSVAAAGTIGDSVEQAQDAASQASSAKDAAVAAQTAAEAAKTAAETASGQAQTAATQAAGSATAAQTAATQAGDAKTDAETARNEAETSASSAANSASDAESAAAEAEQAKTYIENMDMEGETLPAGSSVTVTKTTSPEGNLLFVIGVPQGIQGDKGETGETGATGPQGVSITNATVNEDGDLVITLSSGSPINAGSVIGPQGIQGEVGPTGASVDRIERTSGTGAPGTTDTYTVYLTDGKTGGTFQVYNGSNGTGSGDFMADGSVPMTGDLQMGGHKITNLAEPTDNTDAASKEYVDDTIAVSLVGNYIPTGQKGQANGVASLDGSGKVPNEQLPPMDYVPTSRTVNGHALSSDVTLDADDVGAIPNPTGGTAGQVLTKTADGSAWENAPSGLPDGGTEGQMLYKSADGAEWGDKPVMYVNITLTSGTAGTSDKTSSEINDAVEKGYAVYANLQDAVVIPLASKGQIVSVFPISTNVGSRAGITMFTVDSIGSVSVVETDLAVLDSDGKIPYAQLPDMDYVPTSRTVNGKALSQDISLAASDVGARPDTWTPSAADVGALPTQTGTQGQYLGFTADNTVGAVDAPESGLTQEQADARYLQLTGGTIEVDAPSTALTLKNTKSTGNVSDVNRSPYLNFETGNGKVVNEYIDFGSGRAEVAFYDVENDDFVAITGLLDPVNSADAANKAYVDSKAPLPLVRTITLTTSGWSSNTKNVAVLGVSPSETAQLITPTPAIASQSAYYEAGIMCTGQGRNSLTFTCQTVPTSNLTVYVVIQPLD